MGHRLSRIYTRTGDDGTTGLGDGTRTAKDGRRVAAMGDVDELNSLLGLLASHELPSQVADVVLNVQHDLFDLGGELCIPGTTLVGREHVERLERAIDALNADLPSLKEFILPGGTPAAAVCHLARGVCRRAERALVALAREETVGEQARAYINRLSDYLFVCARALARTGNGSEVPWDRERSAGGR